MDQPVNRREQRRHLLRRRKHPLLGELQPVNRRSKKAKKQLEWAAANLASPQLPLRRRHKVAPQPLVLIKVLDEPPIIIAEPLVSVYHPRQEHGRFLKEASHPSGIIQTVTSGRCHMLLLSEPSVCLAVATFFAAQDICCFYFIRH